MSIRHEYYSTIESILDEGDCIFPSISNFETGLNDYVSPFVSGIERGNRNNYIFYGLGGQKFFEIVTDTNDSACYVSNTIFYKPDGDEQQFTNISSPSSQTTATLKDTVLSVMLSCTNGVLIEFNAKGIDGISSGTTRCVSILFTKDNDNKSFVVCNQVAPSVGGVVRYRSLKTNLYCFGEGDGSDYETVLFEINPSYYKNMVSDTLQFTNFRSIFDNTDDKYTPYAYYKQSGLNYLVTHEVFGIGSHDYISNGFWLIRD